jgi:hypothetical protein
MAYVIFNNTFISQNNLENTRNSKDFLVNLAKKAELNFLTMS